MGREREFLLARIKLALDGHAVGADELASGLPNPGGLDRLEKAALIALYSWSADAEIRALHRRWERFGRQRLQDLSASLAAMKGEG